MLASKLQAAWVLDLFAGSGNLGLEALSRGAQGAYFVDNNPNSLALIKENITRLGFGKQTTTIPGSAVTEKLYAAISRHLQKQQPQQLGFNLIFLDPPYGQGAGQAAIDRLLKTKLLLPEAVIVTEEQEDVNLSLPMEWNLLQSRGYGDTRITIWER